jgi:hypothetical protein
MVDDCAVTIKALNWGTSRFIGFLKRAVDDYGSSRNSIKGFGAQWKTGLSNGVGFTPYWREHAPSPGQ